MIISSTKKKRFTKWEVLEKDVKALQLMAQGKSQKEAADTLGVDAGLLSRSLSRTRKELPKLFEIVDLVRTEKLLESGEKRVLHDKWIQGRKQAAERGIYQGPPFRGYRFKNGIPIETEELKSVEGVLRGFLKGSEIEEIMKTYDLPRVAVLKILVGIEYTGFFIFLGRRYRGRWKPLITPEEFQQIQSRLKSIRPPKRAGSLRFGYTWKDRRKILTPQGREAYNKIARMYLEEKKSPRDIGNAVSLGRSTISRILRDRRLTGKIEVDGKVVDSGFEPAFGENTWKEIEKRRNRPHAWIEKRKERTKEIGREIMSCVPGYRWEILDCVHVKTGISKIGALDRFVRHLKDSKMLKERPDGLLQKSWEPFPDKVVATRCRSGWMTREKILRLLIDKDLTTAELAEKLSFTQARVLQQLNEMRERGIVEKLGPVFGKGPWQIREEFRSLVRTYLQRKNLKFKV